MADLRSLEEQKKKTQVEGVQSAVGIAKTIQQGGVPATSDVVKVLESTESAIDTQKANVALDEKGKTMLRDTENLLGATKELLEKKNIDEKLQTIVAEARLASESVPRAVSATGEQVLTDSDIRKLEELKFKMLETAHIGQEVLKLVISSAEFRQILLTLVAISQNVFFEASEVAKQQPDPTSALQAGAEKVSQTFREGIPEKVPEHLRQELFAEYTALLRKLEAQPEWRKGVTNVFSLLDRIEVVSDQAAEKAKTAAVEIKLDRHAQEVVQSTKELVEEFLPGSKTLDPLINHVKKLAAEVRSDEKMLDYFGRLRYYFERALEDPSLVDKEEFEAEARKLAQEGRALVGAEKYQKGIRGVLDEWREVIAGVSADEELNMFKSALEKLVKDFTIVDATGKRHLDTNAIYQIRQLLVPLIIEQLKFIPIPHLEGSNETYDWTADNIILSGYDIFPDHVKINTASETDLHIRDQTPGWTRGFMLIVIDGIKTKMSDMKFWYKRKSFPRMEDTGLADVDVAGGINIQIRLNMDTENSTGRLMFTTGSVVARADDVKVKVREAKHNWIYSMFPGTFANPIKNGMQKYIAESLAELVVRLKNSLNEAMITVTSTNISETVEKVKQNIPTLASGLGQQTA